MKSYALDPWFGAWDLSSVHFPFSFTHCHSLCSPELSQLPVSFSAQNGGLWSPPCLVLLCSCSPCRASQFFLSCQALWSNGIFYSSPDEGSLGARSPLDLHRAVSIARIHTQQQQTSLPAYQVA